MGFVAGRNPGRVSSPVVARMSHSLITPELLRSLERFQLLARKRSRSARQGERRSRARGLSVEFADHRNYALGDDIRYLDWNLYGRLDRLFLKLYEEERESPVSLFLDASESMKFGTPPKFDFARQVAAAIGYVALCGFDHVSVLPFPADHEANAPLLGPLRSVRGKKSAMTLFQHLNKLTAGGSANLNESLRRGALESRRVGMAVVIGDFLDPDGYEDGLTALTGRGFQVTAIQVLAPEEWTPDKYGDLKLVDSETGAPQEITFGKYRLKAYQQTVRRFCGRLKERCESRGVRYFQATSETPLQTLLLKQLRAARVWG